MDGRRDLQRWKIAKQIQVRFEGSPDFNNAYIEDMTLNGMRLFLSDKLPIGRLLKVSLKLSEGNSVEIKVQFPWVKEREGGFVYGTAFKWMTNEDKDKIFHYINSHWARQK